MISKSTLLEFNIERILLSSAKPTLIWERKSHTNTFIFIKRS